NDGMMSTWAGSTVMSDTAGNLLFYTNGEKVWNRNHTLMPNGSYLNGHSFNEQPCIAILKPGSTHIYYLITVCNHWMTIPLGAYYSVIDMNLDGGLGDIVPDLKNIRIPNTDSVANHVAAIKHANHKDYWIFFRNYTAQNTFSSFLLDENGIHDQPVISGCLTNLPPDITEVLPILKISPDSKYMCTKGNSNSSLLWQMELYKFDNVIGKINSLFDFPFVGYTRGYEFSANSEFFYVNYIHPNGVSQEDTAVFMQYNMKNLYNPSLFISSAQEIYRQFGTIEYYAMQMAPNGKIYIDRNGTTAPEAKYLSAINYPDEPGTSCNFEEEALYLESGNCLMGMPTFVQSYFSKFDWLNNCRGDTTKFTSHFLPPPDSVRWDFDDPGSGPNNTSSLLNPKHLFSTNGTFNVILVGYYSNGHNDTATREVKIMPYPIINLGNDITLCKGDSVTLDAGFGASKYLWNTGATTWNIVARDTGTYAVRVENQVGCSSSDTIRVMNWPDPILDESNLNIAPTTCKGITGAITGLQIEGNPPYTYEWTEKISGNTVGNSLDLYHLGVGLYELKVKDGAGCSHIITTYTINDVGEVLIETALASDAICGLDNGTVSITAVSGLGNMLHYSIKTGNDTLSQWSDGNFSNLSSGTYYVWVNDSSGCTCVYPTALLINQLSGPVVVSVSSTPESGTDGDGTITVNATGSGLTYSINGSLPQALGEFSNLHSDTYSIIVSDTNGCDTTFTVEVSNSPVIKLVAIAGDGSACLGNVAVVPLLANQFKHVGYFNTRLKYNPALVTCQNYLNANTLIADSLKLRLYPNLGELKLSWEGSAPVNLPDGSLLVELSFASVSSGQDSVKWDLSPGVSIFRDSVGNTISPQYQQGQVRVYSIPQATITDPGPVCEGSDLLLLSHYQQGTGNGTISYQWTGPDGTGGTDPLFYLDEIQSAQAGNWTLTVSDTNHCQSSASVEVNIIPLPVSGFPADSDTLWFDEMTRLEALPGYASYRWNTGDSTSSVLVTSEGWYRVIMQTEEGCTSSDSLMMLYSFAPFTMPNAFTPDGDGKNDAFRPVTLPEKVQSFSMYIYDRWGRQVFATKDLGNGWNGIIDGKPAPMGVYTYVISYSNQAGEVRKKTGMVTLVR
ncbi:MAG: gliding motility-associated C-terminal domain-containing protein, partial [Bacteroidales bacterium]|nr:gliding motility-associated C-terminal domain-containing protein [Bacteroidales bacterium]